MVVSALDGEAIRGSYLEYKQCTKVFLDWIVNTADKIIQLTKNIHNDVHEDKMEGTLIPLNQIKNHRVKVIRKYVVSSCSSHHLFFDDGPLLMLIKKQLPSILHAGWKAIDLRQRVHRFLKEIQPTISETHDRHRYIVEVLKACYQELKIILDRIENRCQLTEAELERSFREQSEEESDEDDLLAPETEFNECEAPEEHLSDDLETAYQHVEDDDVIDMKQLLLCSLFLDLENLLNRVRYVWEEAGNCHDSIQPILSATTVTLFAIHTVRQLQAQLEIQSESYDEGDSDVHIVSEIFSLVVAHSQLGNTDEKCFSQQLLSVMELFRILRAMMEVQATHREYSYLSHKWISNSDNPLIQCMLPLLVTLCNHCQSLADSDIDSMPWIVKCFIGDFCVFIKNKGVTGSVSLPLLFSTLCWYHSVSSECTNILLECDQVLSHSVETAQNSSLRETVRLLCKPDFTIMLLVDLFHSRTAPLSTCLVASTNNTNTKSDKLQDHESPDPKDDSSSWTIFCDNPLLTGSCLLHKILEVQMISAFALQSTCLLLPLCHMYNALKIERGLGEEIPIMETLIRLFHQQLFPSNIAHSSGGTYASTFLRMARLSLEEIAASRQTVDHHDPRHTDSHKGKDKDVDAYLCLPSTVSVLYKGFVMQDFSSLFSGYQGESISLEQRLIIMKQVSDSELSSTMNSVSVNNEIDSDNGSSKRVGNPLGILSLDFVTLLTHIRLLVVDGFHETFVELDKHFSPNLSSHDFYRMFTLNLCMRVLNALDEPYRDGPESLSVTDREFVDKVWLLMVTHLGENMADIEETSNMSYLLFPHLQIAADSSTEIVAKALNMLPLESDVTAPHDAVIRNKIDDLLLRISLKDMFESYAKSEKLTTKEKIILNNKSRSKGKYKRKKKSNHK